MLKETSTAVTGVCYEWLQF